MKGRRRNIACILIYLISSAFTYAQVISYEIDPSFNTGEYFQRGSVTNIEQYQNEIIVTGNFTSVPNTANWWTNLTSNGVVLNTSQFGSSGQQKVKQYLSGFVAGSPLLGVVNEQGQTSYPFQFEFLKGAYFAGGIPIQVTNFLVYQDSLLLVTGSYYTDSLNLGPGSARQLCLVDSTGAPIPDFPMVNCEPFGSNVLTIDTLSNGDFIIAGKFSHVNGHPTRNVARLNADFSVDTSFQSPLIGSTTGFVKYIDSQDRIWMTNGSNGALIGLPDVHLSIFRLLPNGEQDESFAIPDVVRHFEGNAVSTHIADVLEYEGGYFLLNGYFNEYNGEDHFGLLMINDDGSAIEGAFEGLGALEATWAGYTFYPGVTEIQPLPDGKLLLGGRFSNFGGEPYSCLVRLQPNGIVGVKEREVGKLKLYPNPAQNTLSVVTPDQQPLNRIEVYELSGRLVLTLAKPSKSFDISELPSGIYEVKGSTASGIFAEKLVVVR